MSNIDSDFRKKGRLSVGQVTYGGRPQSPGIYNPNGSTSSFDSTQMRAERAVAAGRAGATNPIRLGVGEIMPETAGRPSAPNFTLRGSVPAGQQLVPTDGFDPAMRGKTSPLPEPPKPVISKPAPTLASRAEGLGRAMGATASKGVTAAKGIGLPGVLGAAGVAAQGLAMDADGQRSTFYDDPSVGVGAKLRQGARDVIEMGAPAATGLVGGVAGAAAGPVGAIAGGAIGAGAGFYANRAAQGLFDGVDKLTGGTGQSPLEDYNKANPRSASTAADKGKPLDVIAQGDPRYEQLMATSHGGIVGQGEHPSVKTAKTTFGAGGNPDIFARGATPEAELARQTQAGARFEPDLNAALAERVKANGGQSTFRDGAAQALFNIKQGVNGSGIKVTNDNGTPTFSGNNLDGSSGPRYRAADGSVTGDWSKTQQYADAIQRNAKDQDRLAELTRGAALSGDREALARLTRGDSRLEGIAKQAGTERDLREAVRGGSLKAATALADMEKAQSAKGVAAAELALRAEDLRGRAEDRDLNRALRSDALQATRASNQRAAAKDARDFEVGQNEKLDKQLEQYATVKGELDGKRLARLRGLTSNLQRSPGETEEQYAAERSTLLDLNTNLEDGQAWYDRMFRADGGGGTDLRRWRTNAGLRGGYITDQGEHISAGQFKSLTADQQRMFREKFLRDGK